MKITTTVTYEVNNKFDLTYQNSGNSKILTRFRGYFDKEKDILHILDKNFPGDRSVTNTVSEEFIEWVLDEMRVRYIPSAVYCYGSDGQVGEYGFKKEFKFRPVKDEKLGENSFKDFWDKMKER